MSNTNLLRKLAALKKCRSLRILVVSTLLLISLFRPTVSQVVRDASVRTDLPQRLDNCEGTTAKISSVKDWFRSKHPNEDGLIMIIAFPAVNEDAHQMAWKRLKLAEKGLLRLGVKKANILIGEGRATSSLPRIEFFIDGNIIDSIVTSKNKLFCIECCSR